MFDCVRWAAKEALVKASGARLLFPDVYVKPARGSTGASCSLFLPPAHGPCCADPRPSVVMSGDTAEMLRRRGVAASHLSLSHDGEYATAFVVLESEDR